MSIFRRKRGRIPSNATFRLTQEGKEKLQEYTGDEKSRVLLDLETGGTSDLEEISRRTGLNKGQVERIMMVLMRGGYVQYVGGASADLD